MTAVVPLESSTLSNSPCLANDETGESIGSEKNDDILNQDKHRRMRIKNRRRVYLERHPSYFSNPDLELIDPLLYDRCVRRFQSAVEREAEGRMKGYSGILEADLYRSEAKFDALKGREYHVGTNGEIVPDDLDEIPADKEEGMKRWKDRIHTRFLNGEDNSFPYPEVDQNEELDVIEIREAEERWFEDEEPQWIGEGNATQGETGIQDF